MGLQSMPETHAIKVLTSASFSNSLFKQLSLLRKHICVLHVLIIRLLLIAVAHILYTIIGHALELILQLSII